MSERHLIIRDNVVVNVVVGTPPALAENETSMPATGDAAMAGIDWTYADGVLTPPPGYCPAGETA